MTAETHPERIPDTAWTHRGEPYLVPVPARDVDQIVGQRVILSDPDGLCWRHDVVVVSAPQRDHDGRAVVAILDAHDLSRANRERGRMPAAVVPLDRLWIEELYETADDIPLEHRPPSVDIPPQQDHLSESAVRVDATRPPIRRTRQGNRLSEDVPIGAAAILNTPTGFRRGYRVISQPHLWRHPGPNLFADVDRIDAPIYLQCYTICDDDDYYAWAATGQTPPSRQYVQCGQVYFE